MSTKPALRPLDFQPVIYQGQQFWLLRDPLRLSDYQLLLPPPLVHLLMFADGTRDLQALQMAFHDETGQEIELELIANMLAQLDEACLLENERSRKAKAEQLQRYYAEGYRPPALAGSSYPAEVEQLTTLFQDYERQDDLNGWGEWNGRAIVSPHIDYQRGGSVYAQVWRRAASAIAEADLVLIFGTDHNGGMGTITLTRQPYATPFGPLPTEPKLVERLAEAIGPDEAFELELNHREEHSVELSAVWLHYMYKRLGREPAPMVPFLCGSFHHFVSNGHHPYDDARFNAFLHTLRRETAARKVLAVASVDLAHVGPNFGDPFPIDDERRRQLTQSDRRLISSVRLGDHARFYEEIAAVQDRNRICGFSSIYLMLRYLDGAKGTEIAYEHCSADTVDTSFVSICGLLLE